MDQEDNTVSRIVHLGGRGTQDCILGNFQPSRFDKLRAGSTGVVPLSSVSLGLRPGLLSAILVQISIFGR